MKKTVISVLCLSMVLMFSSGAFAASKILQIGALFPVSGSLAFLGEECWRGAELARVQRNQAGGVAGQQVEYVRGDIPTVPAARAEAERMIEQLGMKLLIGTYASSLAMAASEAAGRKGIPYFELGGITMDYSTRGYKTLWRTCATSDDFVNQQISFLVDWFAPQIGKKVSDLKVSLAHEDSGWGSSFANGFAVLGKKAGFNIVSIEPYAATSLDLSSVIFRLRKAAPDIVVCASYPQDAILLTRQAHELKLKSIIMGSGAGHSATSFLKALGDKAEGVFGVDYPQYEANPKFRPGLKEYVESYKKMFKEVPRSGHSLVHFFGANVLFNILDKTGGDMDPEAIRKVAMAMDQPIGKTPIGWGVKFDEKGQNTRVFAEVSQWRGGKFIAAWPKEARLMEPKLVK